MTLSSGLVLDLLAAAGRSVPMPDANSEVRSALLHRDEQTRARTLVVEFPPGFCRPVAGRYQAGEEFLVLAGELDLAGRKLVAGDWAWLPPGVLRRNFSSVPGAIVYAWFSAGNEWQASDEELPCPPMRTESLGLGQAAPRSLRSTAAGDGPGASAVLALGTEVVGPAELLDLASFEWRRLAAGESWLTGPGPALVRWPSLPQPVEGNRQ